MTLASFCLGTALKSQKCLTAQAPNVSFYGERINTWSSLNFGWAWFELLFVNIFHMCAMLLVTINLIVEFQPTNAILIMLCQAHSIVASSKTSHLEVIAGFFRLLMKEILDAYELWQFDKNLIS